jgi:hypothetical protein
MKGKNNFDKLRLQNILFEPIHTVILTTQIYNKAGITFLGRDI